MPTRITTRVEKSLKEFALVLPEWYDRFKTENKYYAGYIELLACLPLKAERCGHLDIEDLFAIADWGGNQHGVKQRLGSSNTPQKVREKTSEAISYFHKPARAIGAIMDLDQWGLSYGSKTLMFMNPSSYAILDSWIRKSLEQVLPPIYDGNQNSMTTGYVAFLDICSTLQRDAIDPFPEPQHQWRLADIAQALFQFAQSDGVIVSERM